jgi:hypothetical protein
VTAARSRRSSVIQSTRTGRGYPPLPVPRSHEGRIWVRYAHECPSFLLIAHGWAAPLFL